MTDWFRSWHGAPTDPKWLGIARRAGVVPGIAAAVAWALMDRASQAEDRGCVAGYDADGLACFYGCEPDQVDAIVAAMSDKGIIVDGRFAAWEKRQPKREDDSAQRVREHRERKRQQAELAVTPCNAPDTDTEAEEDNEAIASSSDCVAEMVDAYHAAMAPAGCPRVAKITPPRKASALQRLKECGGIDGWRSAMARARASPFLTGASPSGWKADFDFLIQAKSFTKLLEGSYDARTPSGSSSRPRSGSDVAFDVGNELLDRLRHGGGRAPGAAVTIDAERRGEGQYRLSD